MYARNLSQLLSVLTASANASRAATVTGAAIDLQAYEGEAAIVQDVAAGGVGTLDGKIQESDDGATGWTDVAGAAFTQVTTAVSTQKLNFHIDGAKRFIRYVGTIVTGPYTFGVQVLAIKKYPA